MGQTKNVDEMFPAGVDESGNDAATHDMEASADESKAVICEIFDRRSLIKFSIDPGLYDVLVDKDIRIDVRARGKHQDGASTMAQNGLVVFRAEAKILLCANCAEKVLQHIEVSFERKADSPNC